MFLYNGITVKKTLVNYHTDIINSALGLFAIPTADKEVTCAPLYTNSSSPVSCIFYSNKFQFHENDLCQN